MVYRTVVVEHIASAEVDWYDCAIKLLEHSSANVVTNRSVKASEVGRTTTEGLSGSKQRTGASVAVATNHRLHIFVCTEDRDVAAAVIAVHAHQDRHKASIARCG